MLRRHAWRWYAIVALALITSLAALPGTAAAAQPAQACPAIYPRPASCDYRPLEPALAGAQQVGWTYLNLNYCARNSMCAAIYRDSMAAWSWTGSAWRPSTLSQGWVYVYPYTGEWRWAWTQSTGWVAASGGRFELRRW